MTEPDAAVLQLTATLLATEIEPQLLSVLQEPETASALSNIEPACKELLTRPWEETDFDDAAVEFCRLFILNPAVPPRAIAWMEKDAQANPVVASRIQTLIDHGTLRLGPPFQNLPPDHIAVLLLVYSQLAASSQERGKEFVTENLSSWLPQFTSSLRECRTHPIYSLAAKLIQETL